MSNPNFVPAPVSTPQFQHDPVNGEHYIDRSTGIIYHPVTGRQKLDKSRDYGVIVGGGGCYVQDGITFNGKGEQC